MLPNTETLKKTAASLAKNPQLRPEARAEIEQIRATQRARENARVQEALEPYQEPVQNLTDAVTHHLLARSNSFGKHQGVGARYWEDLAKYYIKEFQYKQAMRKSGLHEAAPLKRMLLLLKESIGEVLSPAEKEFLKRTKDMVMPPIKPVMPGMPKGLPRPTLKSLAARGPSPLGLATLASDVARIISDYEKAQAARPRHEKPNPQNSWQRRMLHGLGGRFF